MLIKCGELNKGAFRVYTRPLVKADNKAVYTEQYVAVRLLKCLSYGEQLSLVRAGVVTLCLARHRADEITVHSHGEAYHIYCLLNVGLPVASLLGRVNLGDVDIMLLTPVRGDIKHREPCLTGVLRAGQEVKYILLFLDYALLLLAAVCNTLGAKYRIPIVL